MARDGTPVTDVDIYADAGLVGVNAGNIDRVNHILINDSRGDGQRLLDMQAAIDHQNHQFEALFDFVHAVAAEGDNYTKSLANGTFVEHNMTASSPLVDGMVVAKSWFGPGWADHYGVFDGLTDTSTNGYASDNGNVAENWSGEPEGVLGIYDVNQLIGPRVLESVSINLRSDGEITTNFWIQGYNATRQRWENIHYSDSHSTNAATQTIAVDSDKAYSGFRLYLEESSSRITVINELWFNTQGADLFSEAGIQGVDANNAQYVSKALVDAYAADNTLFNSNIASDGSNPIQDIVDSISITVDKLVQLESTGESQYYLTKEEFDILGLSLSEFSDSSANTELLQLINRKLFNLPGDDVSYSAVQSLIDTTYNGIVSSMDIIKSHLLADAVNYIPDVDLDASYRSAIVYEGQGSYDGSSTYAAEQALDNDLGSYFHDKPNSLQAETIGWIDPRDNVTPHILEYFRVDARDNTGDETRIPKNFILRGWNGSEWEDIQYFENTTATKAEIDFYITADAGSKQFKAYTGFAVYVADSLDTAGTGNRNYLVWTEIDFYARPAFKELTLSQWEDLGADSVVVENLDIYNYLLNAQNIQNFDQDLSTGDLYSRLEWIDAAVAATQGAWQTMQDYVSGISTTQPTIADFETLLFTASAANQFVTPRADVTQDNIDAVNVNLVRIAQGGELTVSQLINAITTAAQRSGDAVAVLNDVIDTGETWNTYGPVFDYAYSKTSNEQVQLAAYGSSFDAQDAFDDNVSTRYIDTRSNESSYQGHQFKNVDPWLGYVDKDNSTGPVVLQSVTIQNNYTSLSQFSVEGFDANSGKWQHIQRVNVGSGWSSAEIKTFPYRIR
jgi:hypothetical protein